MNFMALDQVGLQAFLVSIDSKQEGTFFSIIIGENANEVASARQQTIDKVNAQNGDSDLSAGKFLIPMDLVSCFMIGGPPMIISYIPLMAEEPPVPGMVQ